MDALVINLDDSPPHSPPATPDLRIASSRDQITTLPDRRPPHDFALKAFQRQEDLPRLVQALQEHDAPTRILVFDPSRSFTPMTARELQEQARQAQSRIRMAYERSNSSGGESDVTLGRPVRGGEDDSGSSTERDEPRAVAAARLLDEKKREEGEDGDDESGQLTTAAKKKKNKKNKKKKKRPAGASALSASMESEVKDEEGEVEAILCVQDSPTSPDAAIEKGVDLDEKEAKDEEQVIEIELAIRHSPGKGLDTVPEERILEEVEDGSNGPATPNLSFIITPETPRGSSRSAKQLPGGGGIHDEGAHFHVEAGTPEVIVRLPSPVGVNPLGDAMTADEAVDIITEDRSGDVEDSPTPTVIDIQVDHSREPDQAFAGKRQMPTRPLTPPHSPRTSATAPSPEKATEEGFAALFEQPYSPDLDHYTPLVPDLACVYPLARSWTLYHSHTGPATASPTPSLVLGSGMPAPSPARQGAEAFSHGLFKLFTARTVDDLLGTWKALRRKIAIKKDRPIEPLGMPPTPGTEGLGVSFLPDDTNFHFFIESVKPMWEDPMCKLGGKIMITGSIKDMDNLFFDIVLILAGGGYDGQVPAPPGSSSAVVGAVLSKRRMNPRIEIWLGGLEPLDIGWVKAVESYTRGRFPGFTLFDYKPFHGPGAPKRAPRTLGRVMSGGNGSGTFGRGLGSFIPAEAR